MRLLHVYSGNLYGGIETLLILFARRHALEPSLTHEFALCFEGRLSRGLEELGATVHRLPGPKASRPWTVWSARRGLSALLDQRSYDAALCHAAWPHAMFAAVLRRHRVPLAFWAHDALTGRPWMERWASLTPPDLAICNSRYTAGTVPSVFGEVPMAIVHSPHDMPAGSIAPEERRRVRADFGTPEDACVIVQAGRMEPYKGHASVIEALGTMSEAPGWVFWLIGAPQRPFEKRYLESLQASATRLGIADRIRVAGHVPDLSVVLGSADVFCQPNLRPEPFGLVFVEALASGLAVVGSRSGGVTEIVDDSCGVLVPPGDVGALARTLRELVTDRARRESLAAAAPARARRLCDPATQLAALHGLLRTMQRRGHAA
jgi:glycosyltransferase involved in cell wall biosynthesis